MIKEPRDFEKLLDTMGNLKSVKKFSLNYATTLIEVSITVILQHTY
jgi:hypothetical protein